jgi:hypothetical protein
MHLRFENPKTAALFSSIFFGSMAQRPWVKGIKSISKTCLGCKSSFSNKECIECLANLLLECCPLSMWIQARIHNTTEVNLRGGLCIWNLGRVQYIWKRCTSGQDKIKNQLNNNQTNKRKKNQNIIENFEITSKAKCLFKILPIIELMLLLRDSSEERGCYFKKEKDNILFKLQVRA